MTTENWQEAKRIFEGALDLEPAERNKYLATECSGNSVLRDEVECLLKHDAQNSTFLQHAVIRIDAQVGRVIGPYHLIHLIGLGGMGEVWLAEQTHPVRRRVALKLIKAGMDTREVIARFELERQTLD
jgi:eukaryotic-like serine/threonine-protein kinase